MGTGAKNLKDHGDLSNKLVYAMKVTDKMTLKQYDEHCRKHLQRKIPDWENKDILRRLGDCLYDYSSGKPVQRKGVHKKGNIETDLSGKYALLSEYFYYYGDNPIDLPLDLLPIVHQTQGHKSTANAPYKRRFVTWLESKNYRPNKLYGNPQLKIFKDTSGQFKCATFRANEEDIEC